jgi:hypothetical protein
METTEDRHTSDTQPIRRRDWSRSSATDNSSVETELQPPNASQKGEPNEGTWTQDRIPTPVPLDAPGERGETRSGRGRSSCAQWAALGLCLLISLASLALNVVLITNLLAVRQTFSVTVDQAIASLDTMELNGFRYEYHLQQTIPFSGDIPFQQDMVFPFQGNVPINTTVRVPIDAGILGKFTIDVPINTSIPIDIEVPIHVDQTFHVETEIPIDMIVPIEISPDDPAVQKLIDGLREWLIALRESL